MQFDLVLVYIAISLVGSGGGQSSMVYLKVVGLCGHNIRSDHAFLSGALYSIKRSHQNANRVHRVRCYGVCLPLCNTHMCQSLCE